MKPRRDAERVPPSFIDIWIGNIIVSGIEGGGIYTENFLVVTVFKKLNILVEQFSWLPS